MPFNLGYIDPRAYILLIYVVSTLNSDGYLCGFILISLIQTRLIQIYDTVKLSIPQTNASCLIIS